jgi:hypothetical protein
VAQNQFGRGSRLEGFRYRFKFNQCHRLEVIVKAALHQAEDREADDESET